MWFVKLLLIGALVLPCFAQTKPAHPGLTPKSILERIDNDGAKKVVGQLWGTPKHKQWNYVMDRVEGGSDEWLKVADEIRPGTDAGATDDLQIAFARALVRNPNRVLNMTGDTWPLERVCGDYEIEETKANARERKMAVHRAMRKVVAPELQDKKVACLKAAEGPAAK